MDVIAAKMGSGMLMGLVVSAVVVLIFLFVIIKFLSIWIQALSSGAPVSFFDLIGTV